MMRAPRQVGFTVIELLVVIAIVAILVSIALPSFSGLMAKRRLDGAANELSADLQYARSQAVASGACVKLSSSDTSGYVITASNACNATIDQTYKTISLPSGVSVTSGVSIVFTAMRGCMTDNTCTAADAAVTLSNVSGSLQATVNRMGRVTLCAPSGSSIRGYSSC